MRPRPSSSRRSRSTGSRRQSGCNDAASPDGPVEARALTLDQAIAVLDALATPAREMVLCAILTSMNVAEICASKERINLTNEGLPVTEVAFRRCTSAGFNGASAIYLA